MVSIRKVSKRLVVGTSALALAVTAVAGIAPASVSAEVGYGYNVPSGPVSVERLFNTHNGDHFYTTSSAEKAAAIANAHYVSEGSAFDGFDKTAAGSSPVYRSFNTSNGDHFYTTNFDEYVRSIKSNFSTEGVAFHEYAQSGDAPIGDSSEPVFRLMSKSTGEHIYTTSTVERDVIKVSAYNDEGVAFYAPIPD